MFSRHPCLLPQVEFMFEAGAYVMKLVRGAYSCVSLVSGVGLVAFRDPWGIRYGRGGGGVHRTHALNHIALIGCPYMIPAQYNPGLPLYRAMSPTPLTCSIMAAPLNVQHNYPHPSVSPCPR